MSSSLMEGKGHTKGGDRCDEWEMRGEGVDRWRKKVPTDGNIGCEEWEVYGGKGVENRRWMVARPKAYLM
jgi:hypothetical protein